MSKNYVSTKEFVPGDVIIIDIDWKGAMSAFIISGVKNGITDVLMFSQDFGKEPLIRMIKWSDFEAGKAINFAIDSNFCMFLPLKEAP